MQEVFEGLVKDTMDMYEDAIRHTDVVKLLKDLKIQKACADAQVARIKSELDDEPCIIVFDEDAELYKELKTDLTAFESESKVLKYVIDVIESGKFTSE